MYAWIVVETSRVFNEITQWEFRENIIHFLHQENGRFTYAYIYHV